MTTLASFQRPGTDALSDSEITQLLGVLVSTSGFDAFIGQSTPATEVAALTRLFSLARSAAVTLGLAGDADHHNIHVEQLRVTGGTSHVSPDLMYGGAPTGGATVAGGRTMMLAQLDDPAGYTGGAFQVEDDLGALVDVPVSKGCVAVWRFGRRWRWSTATAGTPRFLYMESVLMSSWPGAPAGFRPG